VTSSMGIFLVDTISLLLAVEIDGDRNSMPAIIPYWPSRRPHLLSPSKKDHKSMQHYLKWTSRIADQATKFIRDQLPDGPFVGIHLRNNVDWDNVCKHVEDDSGNNKKKKNNIFASAQCVGEHGELGDLTMEMCKPSLETIITEVLEKAKEIKARSIFIASDHDHLQHELGDALRPFNISVHRQSPVDDAHVSLAILSRAHHFIGNCVSTFTAFVVRDREFRHHPLPSSFFAYRPPELKRRRIEL